MNNILKILKSLEKNESAQKLLSKDLKFFLSNNVRGMNNILKILKSLEKNESAQKLLSKDFKGLKDSFYQTM